MRARAHTYTLSLSTHTYTHYTSNVFNEVQNICNSVLYSDYSYVINRIRYFFFFSNFFVVIISVGRTFCFQLLLIHETCPNIIVLRSIFGVRFNISVSLSFRILLHAYKYYLEILTLISLIKSYTWLLLYIFFVFSSNTVILNFINEAYLIKII